MSFANSFFSWQNPLAPETASAIVAVLLHSLWQGAAAALVLWVCLRSIPAGRPSRRYWAALGTMTVLVSVILVTWSTVRFRADGTGLTTSTILTKPENETTATPATPRPTSPAGRQAASNVPREVDSPPLPPPTIHAASSWATWLVGGWLLGASVMLVRVCWFVWQVGRITGRRVDPRGLDLRRFQELVDEIRDAMGIRRRVIAVLCEWVSAPGICGCLWPVLLVPPAMLTGLPTEYWRVVIAHELAHVRRWDYLVNLAQMVVESLLFFNPAVWWISRQMRIEREACCDAVACRVIGQPIVVARTLVDVAAWLKEGSRNPFPLAAIDGGEPVGSLTDRVHRLAAPHQQPRILVPWYSLLGFLAVCLFVVGGLSRGADLAVEATAQLLSPKERTDKLIELERSLGFQSDPTDQSPATRLKITGSLRTEDGSLVPAKTMVMAVTFNGNSTSQSTLAHATTDSDRFEFGYSIAGGPGKLVVWANVPGFAMAVHGPIEIGSDSTIEGLDLVACRGFTGISKLTDEQDRPISGATVQATIQLAAPNSTTSLARTMSTMNLDKQMFLSDAAGLVQFKNANELSVSWLVRHSGYQEVEQAIALKPDKPAVLKLQTAAPCVGRIVSRETGVPIAGAEIFASQRLDMQSSRQKHSTSFGDPRVSPWPDAPLLAVSQDDGAFRLESLRDECEYKVLVRADGYGLITFENLRAGDSDVVLRLPPPLTVSGKIVGPLDQLQQAMIDGVNRPTIQWSNPIPGNEVTMSSPVNIDGATATFHLPYIYPGRVQIQAGKRSITLKVTKSISDLTIDLAADSTPSTNEPARQVIVRLKGIPHDRSVTGTIGAAFADEWGTSLRSGTYEIVDSRLNFDGPIGSHATFYGSQLPGYFVKPNSFSIPAGEEPLELELQLWEAGAIHGRVEYADGTPCEQCSIRALVIKNPPGEIGFGQLGTAKMAGDGRFIVTSLPFGGTYRILVHDGRPQSLAAVFSQDITINASNPLPEVNSKFPVGKIVRVRVEDPEGKPVPETSVAIECPFQWGEGEGAPSTGSSFASAGVTNAEGYVDFHHFDRNMCGAATLTADATPRWLGRQAPLDYGRPVQKLTVARGVSTRGILLDVATGFPIPNAEMRLFPANFGNSQNRGQTSCKTNSRGEFVFESLEPVEYQVFVSGAAHPDSKIEPPEPVRTIIYRVDPHPITFLGGASPVTLRVKLLPNSSLRPEPP